MPTPTPDPMAPFLDPHPPHSGRGLGFVRCSACAGKGFRIIGSIPDEQYLRCSGCDGSGQHYIEPARRPRPDHNALGTVAW